MVTLGTEESSHCRDVAVGGGMGGECNMINSFRGVKHVYCAKFMLTVSPNGNPIINNIIEIKYKKT